MQQQQEQHSTSFAAANMAASSVENPPSFTPVSPLLSSHTFSYITRILFLHDAENCYIPQAVRNPDAAIKMYESTVLVVLEAIFGKEIARKLDSYAFKVKWKLFLRHKSNNVLHPSRQLLEAIQDFNVEYIDPGEKAGAVDMKIFSAVDDFLRHPDYQCVVLIGGGRDFSASLSKLRTLSTPQPIVTVLLHNGQAGELNRELATVDCPRWLDIVQVGLDDCSAQASSSSYELFQQQVAKRAQNEDFVVQDEGGGGGGWEGGGRRDDDDFNQGGQSVAIPPPPQQSEESGTAIIRTNKGNMPIPSVSTTAEVGATLPSSTASSSAGSETTDVSPPSSDPQLQQLQQLALPGTVVKRVSTPFVRFLERFHTDTVRAEVEQDGIYCRMVVGKGKWSVYLAKDKFREPTSKEIANAEDSLTRLLGSIVMTDAIEIEGVTLAEIRQDGRLKELEEKYQVYVFSFEAMMSVDEPKTMIENDNRSAIDSSSSSVPPPVLGDIPPSNSVAVPPQPTTSSSSSTAKNEIFMKGIPMKWQFEDIRQFVRSRYNITIMSVRFFETSGLENATYRLAQLRLQPSDTYGRNKLLRAGQASQLGHPIPITFEAVKKSSNAAAATSSGDPSLNGASSTAVATSSTLPPSSYGVKSDQSVKKVVKVNVIFRKNKLFPESKQEKEAQEAQEPQETQEGEKEKPEVSEAAPSPPPMDYNNPPEGTGPYHVLQYLRSLSRRSTIVNVREEAWQIWIGAVWPDLVREMWDKFHVTLSIGSDKMAASMSKKPAAAGAAKTVSSTSETVEGGGPLSGRAASANSAAEILPKIDKIGMEGHADNLARAKEALFEYLETEIVHKTLDPPSTTKLSSARVKAMRNLRQETKRMFVRELAASKEMKAQGEQVVSMLESNDVDHEKRSDAVMAAAERVMSDESFWSFINQFYGRRLRRGLVSLLENGDDVEKKNAALAIANFALKDSSFAIAINAEHGDRLQKMLADLIKSSSATRSNASLAIGALSEKPAESFVSPSKQERDRVTSRTIPRLDIPSPALPVVIHGVNTAEAPTAKRTKGRLLSVGVIVVSAKRDRMRFEEIVAKFEDLLEEKDRRSVGIGDSKTISVLAQLLAAFPYIIRMSAAEEIAVCQGLGLPPPSSNTTQAIDSVKIERSVWEAKRFAVSFAAGADEPPMLSLEVAKADWRSICVDGAVRGCLAGQLPSELESFLNEGEAALYTGPKTSHAVIAECELLSSCFGISKVICAAPPKLVAGNDHRSQEEMKTTIKSILDVANEKGLESISLSMIGDVLGGQWTSAVCAELFVAAIREWVVEMSYIGSPSVKQIVFVDSRDAVLRVLLSVLMKATKSEVVADLAIVSMQAMSEKPVDWKLDGSREDVSSLLQRIRTVQKLIRT